MCICVINMNAYRLIENHNTVHNGSKLIQSVPAEWCVEHCYSEDRTDQSWWWTGVWGTAAAAPPPFRPRDPAYCRSCPLVTPYYCRLGDLLCYTCLLYLSTILCVHACVYNFCFLSVFWVVFLYSFLLQYFDTVGWVFWPVKTVSHITYTMLEGT